jgi:hypothetical protein
MDRYAHLFLITLTTIAIAAPIVARFASDAFDRNHAPRD